MDRMGKLEVSEEGEGRELTVDIDLAGKGIDVTDKNLRVSGYVTVEAEVNDDSYMGGIGGDVTALTEEERQGIREILARKQKDLGS